MYRELEAILEMIDQVETFRPIVQKSLLAAKSFGPELYDLLRTANNAMIDLKAEGIKRLMTEHGFTKKEAMLLVMNQWSSFAKSMQAVSAKTK